MSAFASSYPSPSSAYASNVGATARAFLAALFAVAPRTTDKAAIAANVASARHSKEQGVAELHFYANMYQDMMPNLSAELRVIALRD